MIHDVLELDDTTPMMVMELLEGESLGARLDREPRIPLGDLARILLPVISAVGTAHAVGIVHRDLKPDNIFLSTTPDGVVVKVLDFGIAKLASTDTDAANTGGLTGTGAMLGTPYYMAPEQIFGEKDIDFRADVWSLGIILFECLAGERPTQADNVGQILKIVTTGKIPKLAEIAPSVPADVSSLVDRMLATDREGRPTLQEVRALLGRYSDVAVRSFEAPVAARPSGASLPSIPIRTGDRVDALEATQSADASASIRLPRTPVATLAATASDKSATLSRPRVPVAAIVAIATLGAGLLAFAGSRFVSSATPTRTEPSVAAPSASGSSTLTAAVSATPSASVSAAPSATPSATAPSATTLSHPTAKPPSTKPSAQPTTTPTTTATATSTATVPPGGVVDKPPF